VTAVGASFPPKRRATAPHYTGEEWEAISEAVDLLGLWDAEDAVLNAALTAAARGGAEALRRDFDPFELIPHPRPSLQH